MHTEGRGALTKTLLGSVSFELVHDERSHIMSRFQGNTADFGMDTIPLAGPLDAKLKAVAGAGFTQIMMAAIDLVGHPDGLQAAVNAVKSSGLRVTGFQVLRDFEGLSGHLHDYKIDIAKSMLEMCAALDCRLMLMLMCSPTSVHAAADTKAIVKDLRKLAMLANPMRIKIAYESLSWGRTVNEFPQAWALTHFTCLPPTRRLTTWTCWTRPRCFSCNWPTSCGQRSNRLKSASPRHGTFVSSPVRACTARPWPRSVPLPNQIRLEA